MTPDELMVEARRWERELHRTPAIPMHMKYRRELQLRVLRLRREAARKEAA